LFYKKFWFSCSHPFLPKRSFTVDHEYSKKLSLGQRRREEEVGLDSMGEYLIAWENICKPKNHGGLGLQDSDTLNKVLGGKLWWRWLKETNNPWSKL